MPILCRALRYPKALAEALLDIEEKRILMMKTICVALLVCLCGCSDAEDVLPLWAKGAPGSIGEEAPYEPSLTTWLPPAEKATGAAVVICPGGGYGHLAVGHEGRDVGKWLQSIGVAGFMLRYRHSPHYYHPHPLMDAQRAVRTVRARAKEWKIDPARIGILGFSAGGHLASTAITHFDEGDPKAADPIDKESCRPDFAILLYPAISFTAPCTHGGSRKNLLGDRAKDEELVKSLSSELQVRENTPPTFLMHAGEDPSVSPENSVLFYLALRKAGVPAELHIYEKGGHGFGLARKDPVLGTWPDRCVDWMRVRGILGRE